MGGLLQTKKFTQMKNKKIVHKLENDYRQLCVWEGVNLGGQSSDKLRDFFKLETGARIEFESVIITKITLDNGENRQDLFFYVHNDDIPSFSVKRMTLGIRWWEDVIRNDIEKNGKSTIYDEEIVKRYGENNWA